MWSVSFAGSLGENVWNASFSRRWMALSSKPTENAAVWKYRMTGTSYFPDDNSTFCDSVSTAMSASTRPPKRNNWQRSHRPIHIKLRPSAQRRPTHVSRTRPPCLNKSYIFQPEQKHNNDLNRWFTTARSSMANCIGPDLLLLTTCQHLSKSPNWTTLLQPRSWTIWNILFARHGIPEGSRAYSSPMFSGFADASSWIHMQNKQSNISAIKRSFWESCENRQWSRSLGGESFERPFWLRNMSSLDPQWSHFQNARKAQCENKQRQKKAFNKRHLVIDLRPLKPVGEHVWVFFFFRVLHTISPHLRAHAFARSVTVGRSSAVQASSSRRQERRWAIVCGSHAAVAIHRLRVVEIATFPHHCFLTAHPCAKSVKCSPTYLQPTSPDPDSATSIPILTEAGTSVRLSFQSRSLLLLADESSGVTVRMKRFPDSNLLAAGWWWNKGVWRLSFVNCVPCGRQQSWCEEGWYRPEGVHCPSSLVWCSPRWFGSSRVGPGSACARAWTLPTQGRRIRPLSSRGRYAWVWVSMPCTPTSNSRVYGWCYFSGALSYIIKMLCSRCAFIAQSSVKVDA